jgi:2-keto-4-pentenoate hydratase
MLALADRLWEARRQGKVAPVEDVAEPASAEEAYAIQSEIVRLSGYAVRGFKVGSTSKEAQRLDAGEFEAASIPVRCRHGASVSTRMVADISMRRDQAYASKCYQLRRSSRRGTSVRCHAKPPSPKPRSSRWA